MPLKSLKNYRRGDVILTSKPIVFAVTDQMKGRLCDSCLALKPSLTVCKVCQQMFYCNQICQQNDWSYHRLECHTFANTPHMPSSSKIMIRLWNLVQNDMQLAAKSYPLPNGQYLTLNELKVNGDLDEDIVGLLEEIDSKPTDLGPDIPIKDMAILQFKALVETFNESLIDVNLAELWKLFIRVWSNVLNIDVLESKTTDNAYGLFVEVSALDHSCQPNACYVSYGNQMVVRALQHIRPNDKITISYIDVANPTHIRRQSLKAYFLECFCPKCQTGDDSETVSDEEYEEFHRLNALLNQEISRSEHMDSNIQNLLEIAEELVPYYESIYADNYPDFSLFLFKYLRIILKDVVKNKKAINYPFLSYVLKNVRVTHGVDHKIYRKVALIGGVTLADLESDPDQAIRSLKRKPMIKSTNFFISAVFIPSLIFICYYLHLFLKQFN